jgi:hypothetical protein
VTVLLGLKPGDIINVPHGRHEGWAAVVDPARPVRAKPTVMTDQRQLKKLTGDDTPRWSSEGAGPEALRRTTPLTAQPGGGLLTG